MYYHPIYGKESIYIAGPECFYTNGYPHWHALRARAEMLGFQVTMPNDTALDLTHEDLRKNADAIFQSCCDSMNATTAIIVDLEFYRGPDVDGGSIYEMGMAYARGCRCYGYTRDLRDMRFKYQGVTLREQAAYDRKGRVLPYGDLPFSPNVIGCCKIVEGDFDDALRLLTLDITQERKASGLGAVVPSPVHEAVLPEQSSPVLLLSGPQRYDSNAQEYYAQIKAVYEAKGFHVLTPLDGAPGITPYMGEDPYAKAAYTFAVNCAHVRACDAVLADLNDFHGWEPDSDTSFECGMAFQLGKALCGCMDDTRKMIDRIPHFGAQREFRDHCGCNAENFDYPINLMFASSMPVLEGRAETLADRVSEVVRAGCPS